MTRARTATQVRDELIEELPLLHALGKRLAALQQEFHRTPEYERWHVVHDTVAAEAPEWFELAAIENLEATLDEAVRDLVASARHLAADTDPRTWAAAPKRARLAHEAQIRRSCSQGSTGPTQV